MSPSIFVFAALNCEAKPLIRSWKLKKHPNKHPFTIYADDQRAVIITGIGKVAMACAVGYTLASFPESRQPILINLGIAGHRQHSLSSLFLADKIVDGDTGKKFFPQLPFSAPCPTLTVTTQTHPCDDYAENCLHDMEAAAFYETAVKFSTVELIHCLKIVSDNERSSLNNISETLVEEWCGRQLAEINSLLAQLSSLRQSLPTMDLTLYQQLLGQFHFTATNALKLKALLERWQLLMADEPLLWQATNPKSGKELLAWIEKRLDDTAFFL